MSKYQNEIKELIDMQPTTMSKYQIDNFVINEKMTDYKILKQILLELGTRYNAYEDILIDYEILELEIKKSEEEYNKIKTDITKKIKKLEIQKQKNNLKRMKKTIKNHEYEIAIFEENYKKIKDNYESPKLLLQDETGEEIYWVNKFIKEAQIDIMTNGRIGKGVLDAILMLPERLQEIIVNNAVAQAANSNSYIGFNEAEIIESIKSSKKVSLMLNTLIGEKKDEVD